MSIVWLRNGRPYGMDVQLGSVLSTAPGVPSGCSSCIFDQIAASVAPPMLMMRSAAHSDTARMRPGESARNPTRSNEIDEIE